MVRRTYQGHARIAGARRARVWSGIVAATLFGTLLPGCPLSDSYVVDEHAAGGTTGGGAALGGSAGAVLAGASAVGGSDAGTGGLGGSAIQGGTGGSVGGTGGSGGADAGAGASGGGTGGSGGSTGGTSSGDGGTGGGSAGDSGTVDLPDSCTREEYDAHTYVLCMSDAMAVGADDAASECASLGEDLGRELELAWIESTEENEFLRVWIAESAPGDGFVWMGASDQADEGRWVWGRNDDAEQFYEVTDTGSGPYMGRFADFGSGQPGSSRGLDEDCGAFDARVEWHWSDRECDEVDATLGFVCEEQPR